MMNYHIDVHQLLEKYFDGETTALQEKQLRLYFRSADVTEELKRYKPLFAYIDEEIENESAPEQSIEVKKTVSIRRKIAYFITAAAACVTLFLCINLFNQYEPSFSKGNSFVIIDGQYYSDAQLIRSMMHEALMNVAIPTSEYFPEKDFDAQTYLMHNQLRELSSIFSE